MIHLLLGKRHHHIPNQGLILVKGPASALRAAETIVVQLYLGRLEPFLFAISTKGVLLSFKEYDYLPR